LTVCAFRYFLIDSIGFGNAADFFEGTGWEGADVDFISRSYCYTVWSAISMITDHVVRPSVCLSATLYTLWLSWSVYRAKSCTSVFLTGKFLFVRSDTFAVGYIV